MSGQLSAPTSCPTCGSLVRGAQADEGTAHYEQVEVVAIDALLSEAAIEKARYAFSRQRELIQYFGASAVDGPSPVECAVRAAVDAAKGEPDG